eukprot:TRINITY_DN1600_c0_g2_i2.p1 TRINITY_DN1600_c0_g2~~TRINITY_DN1600_c0_g2_i2.p1  ORF type:complete len:269 (+),score=87.91 TRINITY_DN1600_c0_g2_i2:190-996(+)
MAPPLKKHKTARRAPPPPDDTGDASVNTPSSVAPVKMMVPATVDPAEAARQAAAAAQEAAVATAAAEAEAAAVALKSARQARRAERRVEKRAAAAAADVEDADSSDLDSPNRGVVYIGHLPHGFYEEQLRGFFSQFGTVQRVKVARSKKSARAKGYAFVQFANVEVARIAAETMHGYLMFGRLLDVHMVPAERQHARLWVGAERKWHRIPWRAIERQRHNEVEPNAAASRRTMRVKRRAVVARKKLAAAGIDYDVPEPVVPTAAVEKA